MNFQILMSLAEQHQYDKMQMIGQDTLMQGRLVHLIAMATKGDTAELFMLAQAQKNPEQEKKQVHAGQAQPNRELLKEYDLQRDLMSIQKIHIGDLVLESHRAQSGCLHERDLDSMLLFAKFIEAGWRLPQNHVFWELDWEQIELTRCEFLHPDGRLPEWGQTEPVVTWNAQMKRYLLERPVRLELGEVHEQISFTLREEDGTTRDGICYINRVSLEDVWKGEEERFADPEYQKRALEHVTQEEFASMKQSCYEALEQACPRGKYFIAIEYECTLDVNLQFYTKEYLDTPPVSKGGSATALLFAGKAEQEKGIHGLPLKAALIQEPVDAEIKEIDAELFEAHEMVPEWEEKLRML